jgi:ABC-type branched-subunit amino acid transport system ATPase component
VRHRPPETTGPAGTIFSLLGPSGAGKTTSVQILSTLVTADTAELSTAGHELARDPDAVRRDRRDGQFSAVDNLLTGEENLLLMADLHHRERAVRDSRTMLRRSVRRMVRYPSLTLMLVGTPVSVAAVDSRPALAGCTAESEGCLKRCGHGVGRWPNPPRP